MAREVVIRSIQDEILGLGPLEPLLADPSITDILVNGHKQIYVERHGKLELTSQRFQDDAHLMKIIDRIVTAVGRRIDEGERAMDRASSTPSGSMDPGELLALQAQVYRYVEAVDLATKLVERTTSAVKTTLQNQ